MVRLRKTNKLEKICELLPSGPLKEIFSNNYLCKNCVKLKINRTSFNCLCIGFHDFYFNWKGKPDRCGNPTKVGNCWGYENNGQVWSDRLDEMSAYAKSKTISGHIRDSGDCSINEMRRNLDEKLRGDELQGLGKAYYDSIHIPLAKPPSNDSCGTRCKVIKKNQLLDNDGGGESWRPIGVISDSMKEYDAINKNKANRAKKAKEEKKNDPTKDLKGKRKPNTGRNENLNSDDSVIIRKNKVKKIKP